MTENPEYQIPKKCQEKLKLVKTSFILFLIFKIILSIFYYILLR